MGYYRFEQEPDDNPEFKKISLNSLEELPPDVYKELVERSLALANRIKDRSQKLQKIIGMNSPTPKDVEEAYWRTATVEQLAFFEMQINNLHKILENLVNNNND